MNTALHLRLRYLLLTLQTEVGVSSAFSIITALVAQHWETISSHLKKSMTKLAKTGSESFKEESVKGAEVKDTVRRNPEPRSDPATGDTDSHQRPFFAGFRGRLRRKLSHVV